MGFGTKKIRVMIVDDSMLARRIIQNGLSRYPNIEVVGKHLTQWMRVKVAFA